MLMLDFNEWFFCLWVLISFLNYIARFSAKDLTFMSDDAWDWYRVQKLEGEDARIADYFDGIAGTSTGALIACLLVVPDPETKRPKYTAKDAINFYLQNSADVFPQRRL